MQIVARHADSCGLVVACTVHTVSGAGAGRTALAECRVPAVQKY